MEIMGIHICSPLLEKWEIRHFKCRNCGRRKMLMQYFEWYGGSMSCMHCGDEWQDGALCERPFARGWRKQAVKNLNERLEMLKKYHPHLTTASTSTSATGL